MRIYKKNNVLEEARDRIRFIFDEFENITIGMSGGKDSTVIFHLAREIAEEKGRLPLNVMWLDQEAEWKMTVDFIKKIMYREDVVPRWYQMPFRLYNAASFTDHWLDCWKEGEEWLREKDPISIKENVYGSDRFAELFSKISIVEYPNEEHAYISGVRTQESPGRFMGLTQVPKYKWITWGKTIDKKKKHYTLYPIYDWSLTDIWKYINDNELEYNKIYDVMYQYGVAFHMMRVSNLHHETAIHHLFYLQEIEPETYERLTQRLAGVDMAGKMGKDDYFVRQLPYMFSDWGEYRDYLLDKLYVNNEFQEKFRKRFIRDERKLEHNDRIIMALRKAHVQSILTNDYYMTKLDNFMSNPDVAKYKLRDKDGRPLKPTD